MTMLRGVLGVMLVTALHILSLIATGMFLAIGFAMGYGVITRFHRMMQSRRADKVIADEDKERAISAMFKHEEKASS